MKKLYFYFLLIILFSILVYGISEEQSLLAKVTVNPVPGTLTVTPENLVVNAPALSLVEKNLSFSQLLGNQDLNVTLFLEISPIKDWISFSENNFLVNPNELKDIITFIDIPNITTGLYFGNIHAITNSQDLLIPVNITVTDKYKIGVNIDVLEIKVKAGQNISVFTELTKTKQRKIDPHLEGKITVNLLYNVLKGKEFITNLSTTMDVVDYNADTVSIRIPLNSTKGGYRVEVTATHLGKTDNDKDNFQVTNNLAGKFLNFLKQLI